MKTYLVTGGAGFIGSHLAGRLLKNGNTVIVVDDLNDFYDPALKKRNLEAIKSSASSPEAFLFYEVDISDYSALELIFKKHSADVIVHLAARAGVRPSLLDPILYEKVNCLGTINLLNLAKDHEITSFIHASSSSVYGNNKKVPFSEQDPVENPISPYAATKRSNELMCHTYHHLYGMNITCLRFFTVYGPRQRPDLAIRKFTDLIMKDQAIPFFGDGSTARDYTYVDDIIEGVMKAIEKNYPFEIFNLGESETTTLSELVALIEVSLGKKARLKKMPLQPGDVPITYADISKSKEKLDYHPKTKISHGIPKFIDWYKSEVL